MRFYLAPRIRKAAYDHIDLLRGVDEFFISVSDKDSNAKNIPLGIVDQLPSQLMIATTTIYDELAEETVFLAELDRASQVLPGGYVGLSYFIRRWQSDRLVADVQRRYRVLEKLQKKGIVEVFQAADGVKGLRRKSDSKSDVVADASPL